MILRTDEYLSRLARRTWPRAVVFVIEPQTDDPPEDRDIPPRYYLHLQDRSANPLTLLGDRFRPAKERLSEMAAAARAP